MAVVEKQRKGFVTYYVVTFWRGRNQTAERAGNGRNKQLAERLDAQRKREVAEGTYRPPGEAPELVAATISAFAARWGGERSNRSAADDRRNLARFTALEWLAGMAFADVRPRHVIEALKQLRATGLSEKSLKNAYGTFRTMCRDAVIAETISANPCVLPRNFFDAGQAVEREAYSRTEAAVLVSHHAIPSPVRALNALCLLAGLREGEACGRRWRDLDTATAPLMALRVDSQYEGRDLKTKRPRVTPVHPELAAILQEWATGDFVALMGRQPDKDDYIVPYVSNRSAGGFYTRSIYYKAFTRGCVAAGIASKSLHSTRHTMITLARRGGADRQVLSKVTHNAKGEIIDRYTHHEWEPLCAAVLAIGSLFGARRTPRRLGDNPEQMPGDCNGIETPMLPESLGSGTGELSSIPGASTDNDLVKAHTRQSRRQVTPSESERLAVLLLSGDVEEQGLEIALREGLGAAPLSVRPPAKTKPYVARKRVRRG